MPTLTGSAEGRGWLVSARVAEMPKEFQAIWPLVEALRGARMGQTSSNWSRGARVLVPKSILRERTVVMSSGGVEDQAGG